VAAFNAAMAAGKVERNDSDRSKATKKQKSVVPKWMAEDPLEGAFQ
jgi:hypothetical protein